MGGRGGAGTAGASGSRGPHGGRPAPRAPPELAPGLPLLLMPEEARLLAEIGAVTLVSAPRPDPRQHSLALASFKRQQEQGFQEQSALAAEARETRRQELLEKIAEGQAAKNRSWSRNRWPARARRPVRTRLPQRVRPVPPLLSQGRQMEWPLCPGRLCWSSWPLLGLDLSRLGPWIGVSSPKTGRMLAVLPMSFAIASTETCGNEASSSVQLASSG
uniref:Uncharacterized protein n=1 Tax=Canis lupus familiaris TaxID=9615 RepID=A0A8C0YUA5_CANLF